MYGHSGGTHDIRTKPVTALVPPYGNRPFTSWYECMANPHCLRLLEHFMRAAASRTFCTAGSNNPIRIAMIAITTNNSISVKAPRARLRVGLMGRGVHMRGASKIGASKNRDVRN